MALTKNDILKDLIGLGIKPGTLLHLAVSVRSIGEMENGVYTLLEALKESVGDDGAIVANGYVAAFPLPLSKNDAMVISKADSPSYAGALVNAMVNYPGMLRSSHPVKRFVAIGKAAKSMIDTHKPESKAFGLLEQMAGNDAWHLTIGSNVNITATAHIAVEELPFNKARRYEGVNYLDEYGKLKLYEAKYKGGCTKGFPNFIPHYENEGVLIKGRVGNANVFLTKMNETLRIEREILKNDPAFFFCSDPTCKDCRLRWEHSTGNILKVKFFSALKIFKDVFKIKI